MAADAGIPDDQDRHVMRQTRLSARYMAGSIGWSCAGNNPTRPNAADRRRNCPDGMLAQRLSRRPSSPYTCRCRVWVYVRGDREPTINPCAQIESP
jgi:hypothetical protein